MFNKNKQTPEPTFADFGNWDKDLGFLTLMMKRQINLTIEFLIKPLSEHLDKLDTIREQDLAEPFEVAVFNTVKCLSDAYIKFLTTKYFANKAELITFISDSIYVEILNGANQANTVQLSKKLRQNRIKAINALNQKNVETMHATEKQWREMNGVEH